MFAIVFALTTLVTKTVFTEVAANEGLEIPDIIKRQLSETNQAYPRTSFQNLLEPSRKYACLPNETYIEIPIIQNVKKSYMRPEILKTYGYQYLEHRVTTKDHYILTLFRITSSPNLKHNRTHKTPVFVNHGFAASSDNWFFLPPEKTLVFMMADVGYDIWISNARGTSYSLLHETLNYEKDISYWDFSFHEMGIYDLPAIIDMIIEETGHENILYLGYSMASIQLLICLSELPEMNSKIKAAFLFAPAAHMGHTTLPPRHIATVADTEHAMHALNVAFKGRVQGTADFRKILNISSGDACARSAAICGLCDNAFFAIQGVNPPQFSRSALALVLQRFPNTFSVKTLSHFGQLITSCRFQKFDYGPVNNLKHYGCLKPPVYDLSKVRSSIYIYHGANDNVVVPIDVYELIKQFKHGVVKKSVLIPDKLFTHFDFIMAKDADKLLYRGLLNDMEGYIGNS